MSHRRDRLTGHVQDYVHKFELSGAVNKSETEKELVSLLQDWLEVRDEKSDKCTVLFDKMKPLFVEL